MPGGLLHAINWHASILKQQTKAIIKCADPCTEDLGNVAGLHATASVRAHWQATTMIDRQCLQFSAARKHWGMASCHESSHLCCSGYNLMQWFYIAN